MVAPSFQNFEMLTEPFEVSGKMYIKIRNPKTNHERTVRWYSDDEYRKAYPTQGETIIPAPAPSPFYRPLKEVLGFSKGYITIFSNADENNEYFLACATARYSTRWGWYIPSESAIPDDLPEGVGKHVLNYASVFNTPDKLKPEAEINKAVDALVYEPSTSQFVGSVGERLELDLIVINAVRLENQYGISTLHVFEDNKGNQFVWATSAKSWAIGTTHHIRGTVKEHRAFRGANQTVLTRCLEV